MDYGMYGGMGGMGGMGGGSSSTMMMGSSMMGLSSCAALVVGGYLLMNKQTSTPPPESDTLTEDPEAKTTQEILQDDISGERLVQIGTYYLRNTSSNCQNGRVGFSDGVDSAKWLWNFTKVKDWSSSSGASYPVYTIESIHKTQNSACSQRFLTASDQCRAPPTLESRQLGDSQLWIVIKKSDGYQLRSLLCTRGKSTNQYLMQSGGNKNDRPFFSGGSGSNFYIDKAES